MKRSLTAALTLGLALGVAACDDDFLTTPPQDVISDAIYWQTERDFTLAVNAIYREVLDTDQFYMEGTTDLSYSGKDWTVNHAFAMGHNDASNGWSNGIWARLYRGVSRANEVLTQLEGTTANISPTARTQLEAQARFLRGYFYHELLWLFGGVPIYTRVPTVTEAREAPRASRDEVITFVLEDLTAAANGLPTSWPAADYGRATRGAALAYKARAALYEASHNKYHAGNAARASVLFQIAADASKAVFTSSLNQVRPSSMWIVPNR